MLCNIIISIIITQTMNSSSVSKENPSICIPRVHKKTKKLFIIKQFEELFGAKNFVDRVDMVSKGDHIKVFIHMKYWPKTESSTNMCERLVGGKDVKVVYNEPWYWKCSASRVAKPTYHQPRRGPYILVDSDDDDESNEKPNEIVSPLEQQNEA